MQRKTAVTVEDLVEWRSGACSNDFDNIDPCIDQGLLIITNGIAGQDCDIIGAGKVGNDIRQFVEVIGIVTVAAAQDIAARAAFERVIAGIADERIVAGAAVENILAGTAGNRIVIGIAGEGPILGARIGNVLDPREAREIGDRRRDGIAAKDDCIAAIAAGFLDLIGKRIDHIGIVAGIAAHDVGAGAAIEDIVARAADQAVIAGPTDQRVIAGTAVEQIIARTARKDVGIGIAGESPILRSRIGRILDPGIIREIVHNRRHRITGEQDRIARIALAALIDDIGRAVDGIGVVTGTAGHLVVAGAAGQGIVAGAAD